MPTIRVDGAVYKALQERAEAFVDTPNSVIRRILGLQPGRDETEEVEVGTPEPQGRAVPVAKQGGRRGTGKTAAATPRRRHGPARRERAPSGSLLPSERYREPILRALAQRGGSAPARDVIEAVGQALTADFTPIDKDKLGSGGVRWENRVQFVRLRMVEEGLMVKGWTKGVWAITDQGRASLNGSGQQAVPN